MKTKNKIFAIMIIAAMAVGGLFPQPAVAKANYKKVYKRFVQNHPNDYFYAKVFDRANYADLNGDGTPELIMWGPDSGADSWILTIYKGSVKVENFHNNPWIEYIKGKNVIRLTGQDTEEYYQLKKGSFKCIGYNDYGECMWNGKSVSKSTYKKKVKKLKNGKKLTEAFNAKKAVNPSSWVS